MDAFDREYERLEEELSNGEISDKEFREAVRDLRSEQRQHASDCAEEAYGNAMGSYGY